MQGVFNHGMPEQPKNFGERVKKRRIDLGLSQGFVAAESGLQQTDISKIETGRIKSTSCILRLATALQCNPYWLEFGEVEMDSGMMPEGATNPIPAGLSNLAVELAVFFDRNAQGDKRVPAFTAATDAISAVKRGTAQSAKPLVLPTLEKQP